MKRTPMAAKATALLIGVGMVAAACGSSSKSSGGATTTAAPATTAAATTTAAPATTTGGATTTTGGTAAGAMTVTYKINPDAVWDDGTPITGKDFQCLSDAYLNTPGSLSTVGYDQITKIDTPDDKTVVVTFKQPYAPYKNLFSGLLESSKIKNCKDVSADFQTGIPFSGREWKIQSWSPDQLVLVPNDKFWDASLKPKAAKVVMVPKADSDTEIASLKSGETGFIFPQAFSGITAALNDPNIKYTPGYGVNYEGLYFQQQKGPFADPVFRQAFAKSVDRELILKNIYNPIFPGAPLLDCGLWVPTIGQWCDQSIFKGYYDPTAAAKLLTDAGWKKNADGFWADKSGNVPEIRWMVNTGNKRRENTQALMIPELAKAGFKVKADNCEAACVFQKRLPALDYDLGMYINTASPDPTVTSIMSCSQVPGPSNDNKGQNSTGWCNKDASALMDASDKEVDESKRVDQIHQIGQFLAKDAVMLSLFQFPNIAAWRTDKLGGPVDQDAANYQAFQNIYAWEPKGGDTITIGAEQWPECLNPITECSNSSWYQWTTAFKVLPNAFDTTSQGTYQPSPVLAGAPEVKIG